jgi:DNA invertase Pin-like site-specific DNA recombinase
MLKNASKRRFDVVMAWAIDRLGRSLIGLLDTIQTLEACDVDLFLEQHAIDTTTPTGKFEFERGMIRQRINAGKQLGWPKSSPAVDKRIQTQLTGKGILKVASEIGVGTVQRTTRKKVRRRKRKSGDALKRR